MDENVLNGVLNNVPGYIGTFSLDELRTFKLRMFPVFIILNLDLRTNSGTHWVALAIYNNDVFICDSLGTLIPSSRFPSELVNFLHTVCYKKTIHVTKQLQDINSSTCGLYAAFFVYSMSKTNSYNNFLSNFGSNCEINDLTIDLLYKSFTRI